MSIARIGSVTGWLTLVAILVTEVVLPMAFVGQPVSGATDPSIVAAYHGRDLLLPLGLAAILTIIGFLVFATALREVASHGNGAFWANVALSAAVVAAALLIVRSALQMAVVRAVGAGEDFMPTFFAWDFVYNTGVYAMEATYPLAFGLAMAGLAWVPRWHLWLSIATAIAQLVNMTLLVMGLPFAIAVPGTLVFAAWFAGSAWLLGRQAASPAGGQMLQRPA